MRKSIRIITSALDIELQVKHAGKLSYCLQPNVHTFLPSSYRPAFSPDKTAAFNCDSNPAKLLLTGSSCPCLQVQATSVITPVVTRRLLPTSSSPPITVTSPHGFGIQAICLKPPFSLTDWAHSSGVISSYLQTRKMHHFHGQVGEMIARSPWPSETSEMFRVGL